MNQTPLTVNEPYRNLAALTEGAQSEPGGSHTGCRLTGQEFSLFVALLIDSDVVYQCMRFDSYWAFADLTSIPDFFSRRSTFLRSVLPLWCWKGTRLPNLKPWMRVIFALYVVTVPGCAATLPSRHVAAQQHGRRLGLVIYLGERVLPHVGAGSSQLS
jgi:hypothetical protein